MLPASVLELAQQEMLDWNATGMSVMEIGHRSEAFHSITSHAESALRRLLGISENYHVLFLHGPARAHFNTIPLNLLQKGQTADYLISGYWSKKAAEQVVTSHVVADSGSTYSRIPSETNWHLDPQAGYFYYTDNETIEGIEFSGMPENISVPIVSDMTSNLLSRPIDVSRYGLIFAGAQKNIGPSGLVVMIVKKELLKKHQPELAPMMDYRVHADESSLAATPPVWSWYIAGLVFEWLLENGGVEQMQENSLLKSDLLYQLIDKSSLYINDIQPDCRSRMNISFRLQDDSLRAHFLTEARAHRLEALEGHWSTGGLRASLYNAMPTEGVRELCEFMCDFEARL